MVKELLPSTCEYPWEPKCHRAIGYQAELPKGQIYYACWQHAQELLGGTNRVFSLKTDKRITSGYDAL